MSKSLIKKVILLSGGLDSSTLAYYVADKSAPYKKNKIYTLTFDYGQRHKKELLSAQRISKILGAVEHQLVKFDLTLWGASALTASDINVPLNRKITKKTSIPVTYVPARNTIFLAFALAYAEAIGAEEIYIGVNSVDYSGYVDCRKEFIDKFQELAKLATVQGVYGKAVKIKTPLIKMSKSEIIKLGEKLGVDWKSTWSCYLGGKKACGQCDSCQLRLLGFLEAGVKDTLKYS